MKATAEEFDRWYADRVDSPARRTGARLVGLDFSAVAIEQARRRPETSA